MAQQLISVGAAANDGTGDTWRASMIKANDNFTELFDIGTPNNEVIINVLSDFPAEVGGVITLAASTLYRVSDDISIGDNRFVLSQDSVIDGLDSSVASLTYTGSGDMFTASNTANKITRVTLDAPSGRLFNISGTGGGLFQFVDATVDSCDRAGIFTALAAFQLVNVAYNDIKTDGHTFAGAFNIFTSQTNLSFVNGGSLFDLGAATFNAFDIDKSFVSLAAATKMLTGAASSANINTGNVGSVTGTRIFGAGASAPLSGVNPDDIRWIFLGNDEISDTNPDGLLSLNANGTDTVIAAVNTPVLVAGTWVVEGTSFFTGTTAGRLTYNGERDLSVPIDIVTTITSASGTNKDITTYLALNGAIIANSGKTSRVGASDPRNTSVPWQLTLTTTDFVEVFVENNTDGIDLLVVDAVLRIR